MKRKDEFSQLNKLLKQLPKIEDKRDKDEIYRHVQQRVNEPKRKKSNVKHVFPVVATFVLLLSFSPLLYSKMNQSSSSEESKSRMISYSIEDKSSMDSAVEFREYDKSDLKTTDVTVAMISKEGKVVPITMTVEDLGQKPLELVKEASLTLSEDQDFISTEPIFDAIQIEEDKQTAIIEINDENREYFTKYRAAVEAVILFTFSQNDLKNIVYEDDAKLTNLADENETIEQMGEQTTERKPFYAYITEDDRQMLIQDGETTDSLALAIEQMKNTSNPSYQTLLTKEQKVYVKEESDHLVIIIFEDPVDLANTHELFIEAFLQLANQFGYDSVKFDNIIQDEWQEYQLSTPVETQ